MLLSLFLREPQFQGQTKERLASVEATRLVENAIRDHFDHWLAPTRRRTRLLLDRIAERAEERQRRASKEMARKTATRKLRLPGKLADCTRDSAAGTEIFLVEGDSAGGSAKQARNRETQAILPLRGKILNVASASADKMRANQELSDLMQALGCGAAAITTTALRYERVIIMTDADVDGAHIASLLMTFFFARCRSWSITGISIWRCRRSTADPGRRKRRGSTRATTRMRASDAMHDRDRGGTSTFKAAARSRSAASRAWARCRQEGQTLNYDLEQGQRGRVSAVNLKAE
jgi:hypothetical protein